jgi:hypothetical protein
LVAVYSDGGCAHVFDVAISPDGNVASIRLGCFFKKEALREDCRIESFGIQPTGDPVLITPGQLFGMMADED